MDTQIFCPGNIRTGRGNGMLNLSLTHRWDIPMSFTPTQHSTAPCRTKVREPCRPFAARVGLCTVNSSELSHCSLHGICCTTKWFIGERAIPAKRTYCERIKLIFLVWDRSTVIMCFIEQALVLPRGHYIPDMLPASNNSFDTNKVLTLQKDIR